MDIAATALTLYIHPVTWPNGYCIEYIEVIIDGRLNIV